MAVFRIGKHWVHDYRDTTGVRHRTQHDTRDEAKAEEARLGSTRRRSRLRPSVDPRVTVAAYALHWLKAIRPLLKRRAHKAHAKAVALYIGPRLGRFRIAELRRSDAIAFIAGCLEAGVSGKPLTRGSVRLIYSALRAMLHAAIDDELVTGNVAAKLGRKFHLSPTAHERHVATAERVLEPVERRALLEAARTDEGGAWYPLMLTLERAGLRLGEAVGLQITDVRFERQRLRIHQAIDPDTGEVESPKHGPREVDLSPGLGEVLSAHIAGLEAAAEAEGRKVGRWLFPSQAGGPLDAANVRRALRRLSKAAKLDTVTPQDLRHTFGSTLATTELPQYVQQQMGHRDINTTMGTYGSAFNARPRRGVALMDVGMPRVAPRASGEKVVSIRRGRTRGEVVTD